MLNASAEFIKEMNNDNRNFLPYIDITLSDNTVLHLTPAEIWQGTFKVEDATSSSGVFTIGAMVATKLSFGINNIYDDFGEYDFENASIVAYVALDLGSGTIEKIRMGTFKVFDYPTYTGSIIYVTALDSIGNFNKSYNSSTTQYPATLLEIVKDACADCDVTFLSNAFDNSDMIVGSKPESDTVTYADIISCAAQIAGCYARCDPNGNLYFDWYKFDVFVQNQNITGGRFDLTTEPSYQTGSSYYGGNFTDYSTGDTLSGGTFSDQSKYWVIYGIKTQSVATDDVVVTGVKVTESFTETDAQKISSYTSGTESYLVTIENNPLIQYGKAQSVCQFIYNKIVGMRFRPCSATFLRNPLITSGDIAYLVDEKSNEYQILITENTYSDGNDSSISCDAESASRSIATVYSEAQKSYAKAKAQAQKDISMYNLAVQQLTNLITQSFGVYKTEQKQTDGSVIYLLHNKPTVAESQTIWKMTADAFSVSTDGGQTWNAGFDSSGNVVVNVLNAIGVNADWIHGGTLYLGGTDNVNGTCYVEGADGTKLVTLDKSGITLSPTTKIAWNNVADTETNVSQITKDTVTTSYVNALNITANSVAAENITGTTLSGKTISGGSITIGTKFSVDSSGNLNASSANISGTITADRVITSSGDGVNGSLSYVKDITYTTGMDSFVTHVSSQDGSIRYVSSVGYNTGSVSFQDKNGTYHSFTYLTSISVGYSDATFVKSVSETQSGISFAKEISSVAKGHLNCTNGIIYSIQ